MLDVKESVRETTDAEPDFDRLASLSESIEAERNGRPEMVVVMGVIALGAMMVGFLLGLLF